jgi:lysophospholipase L1-like esterase
MKQPEGFAWSERTPSMGEMEPVNKEKRKRGKTLIYGSLVVLGVLLIMAAFLEAGLRMFGFRGAPESIITNMKLVDDPILDWRYVPNSRFQEGNVVYQYNESGFRGEDHKIEKAPGIVRIVVLGDSVTDGYGVHWQDAFATMVQTGLGNRYEVINLGMGGVNTPQEIHLLEGYGLRFSPDYVVVNFILNDSDFFSSLIAGRRYDDEVQKRIGLLGIQVSPKLKRLLKSSALVYFVKVRLEDVIGRINGEPNYDYYMELWANEASKNRVSAAFDRLEILSRQHGFKVAVLIWPLLVDYSDYKFRFAHEWVSEQVKARGFVGLDLLPSFANNSYRALQVTSEDHVHPNAAGHKLAAMEFVEWMSHAETGQPLSTRVTQ